MIRICSSSQKIFNKEDCLFIQSDSCLKNETYCFQIFVSKEKNKEYNVNIHTSLNFFTYVVKSIKVDAYRDKVKDDYYIRKEHDLYPDVLLENNTFVTDSNGEALLFVELLANKPVGKHLIEVEIADEKEFFNLEVLDNQLVENDLLLTNWMHMDCICNYYNVKFWSTEFIEKLNYFLKAYVKMGNNMILVPIFTPALDTEEGKERLTTQLVKIDKIEDIYYFDFSKLEEFIDLCVERGIKYFEFAHLFTQWGGKFCPKIMITENGVEEMAFGWHVSSTDERYFAFLEQFLTALLKFINHKGIKQNCFFHLTDEPSVEDLDQYVKVANFVRRYIEGIPVLDALSHYDFMNYNVVDLPVVSLKSKDLPKFLDKDNMVYYCVGVDEEFITNRYFDMPLQRVEILGFQLYQLNTKGFLHWGFNFYNAQFSKYPINPYENATAGGGFPAGDSFIVYPGDNVVVFSLRYFSMIKAFEDYRLLKTLEKKIGREGVLKLLQDEKVIDVRTYPKSAKWHMEVRDKIRRLI